MQYIGRHGGCKLKFVFSVNNVGKSAVFHAGSWSMCFCSYLPVPTVDDKWRGEKVIDGME